MTKDACIVIGGGVMGLATAWRLGAARPGVVRLLEARAIGHDEGSSHGHSRVSRSAYAERCFVDLMRLALAESWPELEARAGTTLLHASPACLIGAAGGPIESYAAAAGDAGARVEVLTPERARQRHPALRFRDDDVVVHDASAAVVAAADTVAALARLARADGIRIHEGACVTAVKPGDDAVRIELASGERLAAERVVIAAGAWAPRLVPELTDALRVVRQTVGFFAPPDGLDPHPGSFPIWARFGRTVDEVFYGLPALGRPGLKVARHELRGRRDDPDARPAGTSAAAVARLRYEIEDVVGRPVGSLLHAETCLYTCTSTEDFVMDTHPTDPRVVVGAGFSGHGFKMAPLVGRILAELALEGVTSVAPFEAERARFSIGRFAEGG